MKRFVLPASITLFLAISLAGCDKYPEGPSMSFRTQEGRVINKWKAEYVVENGDDRTYNYDSITWEFRDDGDIEFTTTFMDSVYYQEGLWDIVDDGATLRVLYTDPAIYPDRTFFEIIRLKEKELWLKDDRDSMVVELRLIPA